MNVLFLDINGVMDTHFHLVHSSIHIGEEWCPVAVANVKKFLDETDSKIVVTSTFRIGESVVSMKGEFFNHYGLGQYVVGLTPVTDVEDSRRWGGCRGEEIQRYIDEVKGTHREVEKYVIVDDDRDMNHLRHKLIYCNDGKGFCDERFEEAMRMFTSG